MNPQLQGKDKTPVDADLSPSNFLLNHLSAQQRMAHQVGLQQRDSLFLMRDQRRNDNFLAAAVQQQLVASLTSPTMQLYGNLGSQPHVHPDLASGLLSRAQQNHHNASSLVQRLSGQSTSPHSYFSMGMAPKLLDSLVREAAATSGAKRPTTVQQIPCLARGMATDHNSMTAYFEIACDVTHGQHLYCSHPVCRAAGVKFRYCLYCKKPVTKQNFRSRHLHADVASATTDTSATGAKKRKHQAVDIDSTASDQASSERGEGTHESEDGSHAKGVVMAAKVRDNYGRGMIPNNMKTSGEMSSETEALSSHLSTAIVSRAVAIMQDCERTELQAMDSEAKGVHGSNHRLTDPVTTCLDPGSMMNVVVKEEDTGRQDDGTSDKLVTEFKESSLDTLGESGDLTTASSTLQTLHRRSLWLALYSKRPQDLQNGMDTWLCQVLAVSDPARSWTFESDKVDVADCKGIASSDELVVLTRQQEQDRSKLAQWLSLLDTRPETTVQGAKATAWLKRVLEVSCQDFEDDDSSTEHKILKT